MPKDSTPILESIAGVGLTPKYIADQLKQAFEAVSIKIDKHGNVHETKDWNIVLRAIEIWGTLTGVTNKKKKDVDETELLKLIPPPDQDQRIMANQSEGHEPGRNQEKGA